MTAKNSPSNFLTIGLALFSMFFGAGNLIFPLLIGKSVGQHVWSAIAGLSLTAIIMPFLGLATMILFKVDYGRFFGRIGKIPGFALLLLLNFILGPFGVIPRLMTLMHAMAKPYLWDVSIIPFSILLAALLFICSFRRQKLVRFLGFLTPFLLLCIVILVVLGLARGTAYSSSSLSPVGSFLAGLMGGYNTMDLIAAFVFASVVLPHFLYHERGEERVHIRRMLLPTVIAAFLLLLTYTGLCFISAFHSWTLETACPPEQLLGAIAMKILGPVGGIISVMTIILACFTTVMTLTAIFAEYLRKDICREKISLSASLILTLSVSVFFANLGFEGVSAILSPILQIIYPGLIVLTLWNFIQTLARSRRPSSSYQEISTSSNRI